MDDHGPGVYGRCQQHNKLCYERKRDAKRAARRTTGEHVDVYRCSHTGMYHVGHLSPLVIRGAVSRDQMYRRAA